MIWFPPFIVLSPFKEIDLFRFPRDLTGVLVGEIIDRADPGLD